MNENNGNTDSNNSFENKTGSKQSKASLPGFLTKPVIKSDSKIIQYSGLGIQLAAVILIFLFIGKWLDGKFDTGFLFTLSLTFIGFFGGFYSFYLSIMKLVEQDKIDKKNRESKTNK